jgi:hypothetical protein
VIIKLDAKQRRYEALRGEFKFLETARDETERQMWAITERLMQLAIEMGQIEPYLTALTEAADIVAAMETEEA